MMSQELPIVTRNADTYFAVGAHHRTKRGKGSNGVGGPLRRRANKDRFGIEIGKGRRGRLVTIVVIMAFRGGTEAGSGWLWSQGRTNAERRLSSGWGRGEMVP